MCPEHEPVSRQVLDQMGQLPREPLGRAGPDHDELHDPDQIGDLVAPTLPTDIETRRAELGQVLSGPSDGDHRPAAAQLLSEDFFRRCLRLCEEEFPQRQAMLRDVLV
jgi:hypothetical protein